MTISRLIFVTTLLFLFLIGCKQTDTKSNQTTTKNTPLIDSISAIDVLYYNALIIKKSMIAWDDIKPDIPPFKQGQNIGVLDAHINNPKVISEIQQLVESLQPATDNVALPDYRIAVTLRYKSGKTQRLGLTDYRSLHLIYLDDVAQQTNNRLLYLIKNNIGLYPWLIGDDLAQQSELYDNSFMKEPFIQSNYYKEWQKTQ